ncbi:MAG: hypothetical protein MK135_05275, partial [Polyangiaceae bacterium]|nr:hypothetical protein [Polyangiaceae bacterium]
MKKTDQDLSSHYGRSGFILLVILAFACSEIVDSNEEQSEGQETPGTKSTPSRAGNTRGPLAPSQSALQLPVFQVQSLAALAGEQIPLALRETRRDEQGQGGAGGAAAGGCESEGPISESCRAIQEVKQRFFTAGPTAFQNTLAQVDQRLFELMGAPGEKRYIPCLDATATESRLLDGINYEAYAELDFSLDREFPDGSLFQPEVDYLLSCAAALGAGPLNEESESWLALGAQGDTLYVVDAQQNGPSTLSIVGPGQRLEVWSTVYSVGGEWGIDANFDEFTDSEVTVRPDAAQITQEFVSTYGGSTGVVHLLAEGEQGFFELTATGAGMGSGCGMQLQIRDDYLLYRENANSYGRCSPDDYKDAGLVIYDELNGQVSSFGDESPFLYDSSRENFG